MVVSRMIREVSSLRQYVIHVDVQEDFSITGYKQPRKFLCRQGPVTEPVLVRP